MNNPQTKLRVTMTDGEVIECDVAADTVEKVLFKLISKYGTDRVLSADPNNMLISYHQLSASSRQFRKVGNYYLSRDLRTAHKKSCLESIANNIGISMRVDIVPK